MIDNNIRSNAMDASLSFLTRIDANNRSSVEAVSCTKEAPNKHKRTFQSQCPRHSVGRRKNGGRSLKRFLDSSIHHNKVAEHAAKLVTPTNRFVPCGQLTHCPATRRT